MKFFLFATGALAISLIPCEPVNAQYQMYSSPGRFMGGGGNLQDTQLRNQVQTNEMNIRHMQMQQNSDRYFNSISNPRGTYGNY